MMSGCQSSAAAATELVTSAIWLRSHDMPENSVGSMPLHQQQQQQQQQ
jgi:hypothetical protein